MGGYLPMYQDGDMVDNPDRVAIGAINPRTGQPYTKLVDIVNNLLRSPATKV